VKIAQKKEPTKKLDDRGKCLVTKKRTNSHPEKKEESHPAPVLKIEGNLGNKIEEGSRRSGKTTKRLATD